MDTCLTALRWLSWDSGHFDGRHTSTSSGPMRERLLRPPSGSSSGTFWRCSDMSIATTTASVAVERYMVMIGHALNCCPDNVTLETCWTARCATRGFARRQPTEERLSQCATAASSAARLSNILRTLPATGGDRAPRDPCEASAIQRHRRALPPHAARRALPRRRPSHMVRNHRGDAGRSRRLPRRITISAGPIRAAT